MVDRTIISLVVAVREGVSRVASVRFVGVSLLCRRPLPHSLAWDSLCLGNAGKFFYSVPTILLSLDSQTFFVPDPELLHFFLT